MPNGWPNPLKTLTKTLCNEIFEDPVKQGFAHTQTLENVSSTLKIWIRECLSAPGQGGLFKDCSRLHHKRTSLRRILVLPSITHQPCINNYLTRYQIRQQNRYGDTSHVIPSDQKGQKSSQNISLCDKKKPAQLDNTFPRQ